MMSLLLYIFYFIFYLVTIYISFNCIYLLVFAIAGHLLKKRISLPAAQLKSICILIPAYKEDNVILESSARAVLHQYKGVSQVIVIADGLKDDTIQKIRSSGAEVIPVNFQKSTKGKSLLYAIDSIKENYDIALVLDIDNIMAQDYLNDLNEAFNNGAKVVQTHRTAKNIDTPFAFLDACNEEINNHIYRKGHFAFGLSPALIGSGMAFSFDYLSILLRNIGETVGEDKELDFKIARDKTRIVYLEDTYVYDEKIDNAAVFTQQRTRWIAAQIEFFKKYFIQGFVELFKNKNYEFFNKVLQSMLVPRMLLLGLLFVLSLLSFAFLGGSEKLIYPVLFCLLCFTLMISLPLKFYRDKMLLSALWRIPYALSCMVMALFRLGQAKSSFLPTPHTSNSQIHKSK